MMTGFILSAIVMSGPPTQVWPYVAGINLVLGIVGVAGALQLKETKSVEL
jgi:hypothetical protein